MGDFPILSAKRSVVGIMMIRIKKPDKIKLALHMTIEIKKAAKEGQMGPVKIMAKVIRMKKRTGIFAAY